MPVDRFDFDDHAVVDDQVQAETTFETKPLIDDRDHELLLQRVASKRQLMDETRFVNRLKQTRSQRPMDLEGGIDDWFVQWSQAVERARPPLRLCAFAANLSYFR